MRQALKRAPAGFTLVELIVVIVILGILTSVALPRLSKLDHQARVTALERINTAMKYAHSTAYAASKIQGLDRKVNGFLETSENRYAHLHYGHMRATWPESFSRLVDFSVNQYFFDKDDAAEHASIVNPRLTV